MQQIEEAGESDDNFPFFEDNTGAEDGATASPPPPQHYHHVTRSSWQEPLPVSAPPHQRQQQQERRPRPEPPSPQKQRLGQQQQERSPGLSLPSSAPRRPLQGPPPARQARLPSCRPPSSLLREPEQRRPPPARPEPSSQLPSCPPPSCLPLSAPPPAQARRPPPAPARAWLRAPWRWPCGGRRGRNRNRVLASCPENDSRAGGASAASGKVSRALLPREDHGRHECEKSDACRERVEGGAGERPLQDGGWRASHVRDVAAIRAPTAMSRGGARPARAFVAFTAAAARPPPSRRRTDTTRTVTARGTDGARPPAAAPLAANCGQPKRSGPLKRACWSSAGRDAAAVDGENWAGMAHESSLGLDGKVEGSSNSNEAEEVDGLRLAVGPGQGGCDAITFWCEGGITRRAAHELCEGTVPVCPQPLYNQAG